VTIARLAQKVQNLEVSDSETSSKQAPPQLNTITLAHFIKQTSTIFGSGAVC